MKQLLTYVIVWIWAFGLALTNAYGENIRTGADRTEQYLPLLKGKRVTLVVNQTSRTGDTHLLDTLCALGIRPVQILAPEHGFRGTADAERSPSRSTYLFPVRKEQEASTGTIATDGLGGIRHSGCRCPLLYLYQYLVLQSTLY